MLPTHFTEHPFSYLPAKYCPNLNKPQTIYLIASLRANPAPFWRSSSTPHQKPDSHSHRDSALSSDFVLFKPTCQVTQIYHQWRSRWTYFIQKHQQKRQHTHKKSSWWSQPATDKNRLVASAVIWCLLTDSVSLGLILPTKHAHFNLFFQGLLEQLYCQSFSYCHP